MRRRWCNLLIEYDCADRLPRGTFSHLFAPSARASAGDLQQCGSWLSRQPHSYQHDGCIVGLLAGFAVLSPSTVFVPV